MYASLALSCLLAWSACADRAATHAPAPVAVSVNALTTPTRPAAPETATTAENADSVPIGEDIATHYRALHDGTFAAPPTEFRSGHVSSKGFAAEHITRTDTGFRVKFPSKAPIVTPAVYRGNVVVSGGFRSKEMYAFNAKSGVPAWGAALDDDGPSAPACAEGMCAFNTESCTLFVVDAATGKMIWSKWLGDPLASAPTIAGGVVFTSYPAATARGGYGNALQNLAQHADNPPEVAAPAAPAAPPNPVAAAATPAGAKGRPPGMTHALAAFDLKTGKILWQRWLDAEVMSAPVADGDAVYVTTFAGTYLRLGQKDGAVQVARKVRATSPPTVLASGDVVFSQRADAADGTVGEAVARLGANPFDPDKRKQKAAAYLDSTTQSTTDNDKQGIDNDSANGFADGAPGAANPQAAYHNVGVRSVYTMQAFQGSRLLPTAGGNINTMGDEVVCTDPSTGAQRWSLKLKGDLKKVGGALAAPPAEAGGKLFVATLTGKILVVDPTTGKTLKTYEVGSPVRAQPVVHDGWIYVGTVDGQLVAIDTGERSWTGWSHWGGNAQRTGKQG